MFFLLLIWKTIESKIVWAGSEHYVQTHITESIRLSLMIKKTIVNAEVFPCLRSRTRTRCTQTLMSTPGEVRSYTVWLHWWKHKYPKIGTFEARTFWATRNAEYFGKRAHWKHESLHICKFERMKVCTYANLNAWKSAHRQIWTHESLHIGKFERMKVCT